MTKITASDVAKLRRQTGAGMMDCKKALVESNGDFEIAVDVLRKKGQKVAAKRADRDASEGVVIAKNNSDNTKAILVSLNCETDFVAKNDDFINLAYKILDTALENDIINPETLNELSLGDMSVSEKIIEQTGVIGEKLEVSCHVIEAKQVSSYIHAGNRLATIVGFSDSSDEQVTRDVAMQVAAMNPLALSKEGIDESTIARELEVGKDLAIQEGKPAEMADKIAQGRLGKFFKENTLLSQPFVRDNKQNVEQFLNGAESGLTVTEFKRLALS